MAETSIIIRTFNEEKHIGNLLQAIKKQEYNDYEIILVDSGSTDKTLEIIKESTNKILQIESRDFTFGYSLNMGCQQALGKYIVLVSAHVIPTDSQWLSNLLAPFSDQRVGMVYGRQMGAQENKFSEKKDLERIYKKSPYPNNANSAFRKEIWQDHNFDEYLFGLEDIEFTKYVIRKGFFVHYEPKASIYHIHTEKWPQIFNRYRREAIAAVKTGLPHPPQARTSVFWLAKNLFYDCLASFPNVSPSRLEEIGRFRYYQWKGTRQGWFRDANNIDINQDKYSLFYPAVNRAVVIKNKNQAALEEISLPEIKPGDILIKVNYTGICRTDLEVYDGSLGYYRDGLAKYPIVPGHEFSGEIMQIGANNKFRERFKIGEKVVGECILFRGIKSQKREVGVINYNGAYSQFIVMPGDHVHKIPDSLDLKTACLAEPLAVVLRGIKKIRGHLKQDSRMAIMGAGPIGNFSSQVLAQEGYAVSVFDRNQKRLEIIRDKVKTTSQNIDNLQNFDFIIEATGSADVLKDILEESQNDAILLLLGFPYGKIDYNFEDIVGKEKVVIGSVGANWQDFEKALELLPKIDTFPFTQTVLSLEDFSKAWQLQKTGKHLKIILKP